MGILKDRLCDTHFQSAQFCQSAQAADAGVSRIGFLLQVVHHLVSVVGTHGDGYLSLLLQFEESFHDVIHIHITFQVVGFVEVAFCVTLCAAEVDEVDTVTELLHHAFQVVGAAYTERTGAKTKSVALVGNGIYQCLEIGSAAHNARQAEDGAGGIIRMDNQLYTGFVGNRSDFLQEVNQVGTQLFRCDVFVAVEFLLELLQCEALFRTGQSGNHVADEQLLVGIRHLLKTSFGLGLLFVGVVVFGAGALQQEEVEGDESGTFETQGAAAVGSS